MAKAAPHKKPKLTDGERHDRFVEMAREVTGSADASAIAAQQANQWNRGSKLQRPIAGRARQLDAYGTGSPFDLIAS
jgi:hypothetical protein